MARSASRRNDTRRETYAVSIDPRLVDDIDLLFKAGLYRSRSHAFEEGLRLLVAYHSDRLTVLRAQREQEEVRNAA